MEKKIVTQKKLSVLMVGPSRDARGGITSVVNGYFDAGIANLCNIHYIGTTSNGSYVSKAYAALRALQEFVKLLPKCDIVHIHLGSGISMIRKNLFLNQAKRAGKPVIVHDHRPLTHDFLGKGSLFLQRNRHFLAKADAIIVLSEGERNLYIKKKLCLPSKINVIHNAVMIPSKDYFSFQTKRVVSLAKMTFIKGQDILIKAIPSIVNKVPNAKFLFIGNGDSTPYRNLAKQLGVMQFCTFAGWVSGVDKEHILERSSVYVQSSRDEGMSMSLLEAMAKGMPVVATNVGGTSAIIRNGMEGFLIPSCDGKSLANRVVKLLTNKQLSEKMSQASRQRIESNFNLKKQLRSVINLYSSVIRKQQ